MTDSETPKVEEKTTEKQEMKQEKPASKKNKIVVESTEEEREREKKSKESSQKAKVKKAAEKKQKKEKKEKKVKQMINKNDKELLDRTLFVGNLPTTILKNPNLLKKLFSKYGEIDNFRFRSVAVNSTPIQHYSQKTFRKAGVLTGNLSDEKQCLNAYIVYKAPESVQQAKEMNNYLLENRHLRVDDMNKNKVNTTVLQKNTIFIGNLPFHTDEEELREYLNESINKTEAEEIIENIHIVRDRNTQKEVGIAFVQLKACLYSFSDSVYLPQILLLNNKKFKDRELRISRYNVKETLKAKREQQKKLDQLRKSMKDNHISLKKKPKKETPKKMTKAEEKEEKENKELKNDLEDVWKRLNDGETIEDIEKSKPIPPPQSESSKDQKPAKKVTEKKKKRPMDKSFMGQKSKHSLKEMKYIEKKMKK